MSVLCLINVYFIVLLTQFPLLFIGAIILVSDCLIIKDMCFDNVLSCSGLSVLAGCYLYYLAID